MELSLEELCRACGIRCTRCLDTGKFWRPRGHWLAALDGRGSYDLFRCPQCSDGHWFSCSHTNVLFERGIKVFHYDEPETVRRGVAKVIHEEWLKTTAAPPPAPAPAAVENVAAVAVAVPAVEKEEAEYMDSVGDELQSVCRAVHVESELGKLLDHVSSVVEAYGGNLIGLVDSIKKIPMKVDMRSKDETVEKKQCCQTVSPAGHSVYFFLSIRIQTVSRTCGMLECLGVDCSEVRIVMSYSAVTAKNRAAQSACDQGISCIAGANVSAAVGALGGGARHSTRR